MERPHVSGFSLMRERRTFLFDHDVQEITGPFDGPVVYPRTRLYRALLEVAGAARAGGHEVSLGINGTSRSRDEYLTVPDPGGGPSWHLALPFFSPMPLLIRVKGENLEWRAVATRAPRPIERRARAMIRAGLL